MNVKRLTAVVAAIAVTALAGAPLAHAEDAATTLKSMVDEMSIEQQAALLLLLSELSGAEAGGAEAAGEEKAAAKEAMDPKDAVMGLIDKYTEATMNQDMEAMAALVADDFENYQFGDKEGLMVFMEDAKSQGFLEDLEIDMQDAEIEWEDDKTTAIVYPVDVYGNFGTVTFEYIIGKQDDGSWKIIGMEGYGI